MNAFPIPLYLDLQTVHKCLKNTNHHQRLLVSESFQSQVKRGERHQNAVFRNSRIQANISIGYIPQML